MNKNLLFRSIPKVDILLEEQEIQDLIDAYGRELVMDVIREEMDALRTFIGKCEEEEKAKAQIGMLTQNIKRHAGKLHEPNMKMVINGTGTVLHTNLGRAPISKEHVERLAGIVSGYSNLEYNLEAGARGERYSHFEKESELITMDMFPSEVKNLFWTFLLNSFHEHDYTNESYFDEYSKKNVFIKETSYQKEQFKNYIT